MADIPFINEDRLRYPQPVEYQSDSSKAIYVYNETINRWERVRGSSRDRNGKIVPETPEDIAGGGTRGYVFEDLSNDQNWNAINDFLGLPAAFRHSCGGPNSILIAAFWRLRNGLYRYNVRYWYIYGPQSPP